MLSYSSRLTHLDIASSVFKDSFSSPKLQNFHQTLHMVGYSSTDRQNNFNKISNVEKLLQESRETSLEPFTRTFKSFARSNIQGNDYSKDVIPMISSLLDTCPYLSVSILVDWIWSVPQLGIRNSIPQHRDLVLRLIDRLYQPHHVLTAREVTTSVTGMAKFRLFWNRITNLDTKRNMVKAFGDVSPQLNEQEIGMMLHSLSKMNVPWTDLGDVQMNILNALSKLKSRVINRQGSISIYSLGLMGLVFDDLPANTKNDLFFISNGVLNKIFIEDDRSAVQHVGFPVK